MTNAETISIAASRNDLITECSCMRRPGYFGTPNKNCHTCKGHGYFKTCQHCEGCGMTSNAICVHCGGSGCFPVSAAQKKIARNLP